MASDAQLSPVDLAAWVSRGDEQHRGFREAVHIVISAISDSAPLRTQMIMKGGLLMAIRYDSTRFTRDVDFSTREKYAPGSEQVLLAELDQQLERSTTRAATTPCAGDNVRSSTHRAPTPPSQR